MGVVPVSTHVAYLQHSDLKPDNVMVSSDGRVVVCDFGVGRVIELGNASAARAYDGHGGT